MAGRAAAELAAQKKSLHAAERDTERVKALRQAFVEALAQEDVTRFKFIDETSVQLTYTRRYGRAPGGQRLDQAVPLHSGPNVTLVAALTPQGVEAVMELDGALNAASFMAYLEQVLGPTLQAGDVELDDSYFGPRRVRGKRGRGAGSKTVVFGLFKRGGQVYTEIVPNCQKKTL